MRPILAYSNAALPETADEGQQYINIKTGETFTFKNGSWIAPSTPEKVLSVDSAKESTVTTEKPKKTKKKVAKKNA